MAARYLAWGAIGMLLAGPAPGALAEGEIRIQVVTPSPPQAPVPPVERQTLPVPPAQRLASGYGRLGQALAGAPIHRVPDPRSQPFAAMPRGTYLVVGAEQAGYYAILMSDGKTAYVPASHIQLLDYQVTGVRPGELPRSLPTPGQSPEWQYASPAAEVIIREAVGYLDVPYRWGGNDTAGIDCSGLVKNCFAAIGVALPRTAREQATVGEPVSLDELHPGDRLYFASKFAYDHTGIYIGEGRFIHASGNRRKVTISEVSEYRRTLAAARR